MMRRHALCLLLTACTPLPTARSQGEADCEAWRSRYVVWRAIGAGGGALAGAGGLATLAPNDPSARIGVGVAALTIGAVASVAAITAGEYAASYSGHGCVDRPIAATE